MYLIIGLLNTTCTLLIKQISPCPYFISIFTSNSRYIVRFDKAYEYFMSNITVYLWRNASKVVKFCSP
jgi:hypothetical protein